MTVKHVAELRFVSFVPATDSPHLVGILVQDSLRRAGVTLSGDFMFGTGPRSNTSKSAVISTSSNQYGDICSRTFRAT